MERREIEVPKGSFAAGHRARLPRGAEEPIKVYVNGVEQKRGVEYEIRNATIEFARPILKEEKLSGIRWASMLIGVVGTYRTNETVDVEYRFNDRKQLGADVEILPDDRDADRR
jgi:hypothetical protein